MNRRALAALFAAAIYVVGCGVAIRIEEQATTTVQRGTLLEELISDVGFGGFLDMDLTQSQELQNQGVSPGDIEDVRMVLLELEVLSPEGGDLSFLDEMDLFVEAPGLERRLLATQGDFPEGEPIVAFELPELDLTDYVVSESMSITSEVTGHRPSADTEIEARFALSVKVKPAAACK